MEQMLMNEREIRNKGLIDWKHLGNKKSIGGEKKEKCGVDELKSN